MPYDNLNSNIKYETPKHKLKEDESAIADEAIAQFQVIALVVAASGRPHAHVSDTQGEMAYIATRAAAAGELVTYRQIGVESARASQAINAGALVMSDGNGEIMPHATAAWTIGVAKNAASGAGHRIGVEIQIAYR
jgi:hypothetical protein